MSLTDTNLNILALFAACCLLACPAADEGETAEPNSPETAEESGRVTAETESEEQEPPEEEPQSQPTSMLAEDHAGHDHAGHDHAGHDHAGHDHAGHDHAANDDSAEHEMGPMDHVLDEADVDPADIVTQPGAQMGQITRCPVSGELFEVTEEATYFDHEGERVYFCCPSCIRQFQRDPERFLAGQHAAGQDQGGMVEVSAAGARIAPPADKSQIPAGTWICDMGTVHYARGEQGDGECPLCGMRLVEWSGE